MTTNERTVETISAQALIRHASRIAEQLRSCAERIEREASHANRVGERGLSSYGAVAASVQGEFRALLGNLILESLTMDAVDADGARQRRIAAEAIAGQIETQIASVASQPQSPSSELVAFATIGTGAAAIAREYAAKEG